MKDNNILKYFTLLIISTIIIICVAFLGSKLEKNSLINEEVTSYTKGWHTVNTEKDSPTTIPTKLDLSPNSTYRISNMLPEKYEEGMSISICSSYPNIRVFVDNIKVYQYGYERKLLFGNTNGCNYHIIRLPVHTKGTKITIEFTSFDKQLDGKIKSITLGSKVANIYYITRLHLVPFILCILIFLIGILFVVIYFYMNMKFKEGRSLLYLGLFAIIVSVWSATETKILQFFIPYLYMENIITYLTLMLCPIPFLLFLKGASHSIKSKSFNILCTIIIINFIVTNFITFIGISDYREMLYSTHMLILASMILSFYTVLKEVFYYKSRDAYLLGVSIVLLGIFTLFDFIRYYYNNSVDASLYFRVGLLLFIMLIGLSTFKKMIVMIKMGFNTSAIQRLAFIDILTNVKNRTAYVNELDELNKSLNPNTNIVVVMFDLNNLKEANDTFGHETGDALLIAAADCIKKALNGYGICFRIGGDEFAAIFKDVYDTSFFECLHDLDRRIDAYNQKNLIMLEIPYGYTHYEANLDKDLYMTFSRADALMYEAKAKMKANKTSK